MATTTTYEAIRDSYITKIKALSPSRVSNLLFDECPRNMSLRDYAGMAGSAAIRKFQFERTGFVEDPPVLDWTAKETNEDITLTVSYPTTFALYGKADRNDLEALMRSDARQIRDLIFSGGNYLAGHTASFVTILRSDRKSSSVWYQGFGISLIYTEAETLT